MIGLRSVILTGMGQWKETAKLVEGDWIDSSRRLDVVRLALQARSEDWNSFCAGLDNWSDFDRLFAQLAILSPQTFENRMEIENRCSTMLQK